MAFKFPVINPLLHNELRLKIMVALDSLESANFMYLCEITGATRGNSSETLPNPRGIVSWWREADGEGLLRPPKVYWVNQRAL